MAIDAFEMGRERRPQHRVAALGQGNSNDPTIPFVGTTLDQPVVLQPVDEARGTPARQHNGPRQVGCCEALPRTPSQPDQHLEPLQAEPAGGPQLPIEDANELGVSLQKQTDRSDTFILEAC